MKTPEEYIELAERCRLAKLTATDAIALHQLSTLEQSYMTLAESARMLNRANKTLKALEHRGAIALLG